MCLIKLKARRGGHDGENKSSAAAAAATVKFARFSDFYVLIVHSGWCAREKGGGGCYVELENVMMKSGKLYLLN